MAVYKLAHTGQQLDAAIAKVENGYADVSGVTATAEKTLTGSKFVDRNRNVVNGSMPDIGAVNQTIQPGGSYTVPEGYHNGNGVVRAANAAGDGTISVYSGEVI